MTSDPTSGASADHDPAPDDPTPDEVLSRWGDLGTFIRDQRRLTHLSLRKLAELADVSNPYLSQIERGLRKPSADILQQIARALSISSESLYIRAGLLEEPAGVADVVGEIRRDTTLTADQRRTLIRIYQSFQAENGASAGAVAAPDESLPDEPDRTDQESTDDGER